MPSGALGDRLSRLPGVAECAVGDETVRLVATPGTDLRLLRARAQAVCAEAGDRRTLSVAVAPTKSSGPVVLRPQSVLLTRLGGSKAVALGSLAALGLIAVLPGDQRGGPAPLAAPVPLTAAASRQPPIVGNALAQALRLPPDDARRRDTQPVVVVEDAVPSITVTLAGSPASVRLSAAGRRHDAGPAAPPEAPPAPAAAPESPSTTTPSAAPAPAPAPTTSTVTAATKLTGKGKAKAKPAASSTSPAAPAPVAAVAAAAKSAATVTITTTTAESSVSEHPGNKGGNGKGHSSSD